MKRQVGDEIVAATFVEPRGMIRSVVADVAGRQILGALGAASASTVASAGTSGVSPLRKGDLAHLSVSGDQVALNRAKRGTFRPKATDELIATAPRAAVKSVAVTKGRIAGVLEIAFEDGSSWAFDVPKVHLAGAEQIASVLAVIPMV